MNIVELFYSVIKDNKIISVIKSICKEMKKNGENVRILDLDCYYKFKDLVISFDSELENNFYINGDCEIVNFVMNLPSDDKFNGFYPHISNYVKRIINILSNKYYEFLRTLDDKILSFKYESDDLNIKNYIEYLKFTSYKNVSLKKEEFIDFISKFNFDFKEEFIRDMIGWLV